MSRLENVILLRQLLLNIDRQQGHRACISSLEQTQVCVLELCEWARTTALVMPSVTFYCFVPTDLDCRDRLMQILPRPLAVVDGHHGRCHGDDLARRGSSSLRLPQAAPSATDEL
jgi:hypothetical protein